jgi:hypothetical protein
MEKPESNETEPDLEKEFQAEVGHIVHEVTGGEGELKDEPVIVDDVYAFRQKTRSAWLELRPAEQVLLP